MRSTRSMIVAFAMSAGLASVASAQVTHPISLSGGIGSRSTTSLAAVELAPSYTWSLDLTPMAANGLTTSIFGMPTPLPLYGANPADLVMAGAYLGSEPGNLVTHNFSFTDLGSPGPTYDFTVSLDLLPDRTIRTTVDVLSLGSFMPGGIVPGNPILLPVIGVNASGMSSVTAVPTPGAAALAGLGALLMFRRRRH